MTIQELYNNIGGDYKNLLDRIPKEDLIERFVRKYIESDEFDNMISAYEAADYRRVFESAHNLKGMSANLSLNRNNETIVQICESVRHGDPDHDISGIIEQAKQEHDMLISLVMQLG